MRDFFFAVTEKWEREWKNLEEEEEEGKEKEEEGGSE
jgi:hypothetical protein